MSHATKKSSPRAEVPHSSRLLATAVLFLGATAIGCDGLKSEKAGGITSGTPLGAASSVLNVSPAFGPLAGGTKLTIYGAGFSAATSVIVGDAACSGLQVVNDATVTCFTAATKTAGAVDVVATPFPGGTALRAVKGFTYLGDMSVDGISPESAPITGNVVLSITGAGFPPSATVDVGGQPCNGVAVVPPSTIRCTLAPAPRAGAVPVTVKGPDGQTAISSKLLTLKAAPTISSVSPKMGAIAGGTALRITGSGFDAGTKVFVGGIPCNSVSIVSPTGLTCTTAATTTGGTVPAAVQDSLGQTGTMKDAFSYRAAPTITRVSPNFGLTTGGDLVTITGDNFSESSAVSIGNTACASLTLLNPTAVICTTPPRAAAGAVDVTVRNDDGLSATSTGGYTFSRPVVSAMSIGLGISSIYPNNSPVAGGGVLFLNGSGFSSAMVVKVGNNLCTDLTASTGALARCTIPAGAAGRVAVTIELNDAVVSLGASFTYVAGQAPTIAAIAPAFGPIAGNTSIKITGSGFTSGTTVTIGSFSCTSVTIVDAGTLTCLTPAGTYGAKDVIVTTPDTQTAVRSAGFAYGQGLPPAITAVSPTFGSPNGGTTVTVTGSNFATGAIVTIAGIPCTTSTRVSAASMTCVTPAGTASTSPNRTVAVLNPDGQSASLANAFYWSHESATVIRNVYPSLGLQGGGNTIYLTGTNFVAGAVISVGPTACTTSSISSPTWASCVVPPGNNPASGWHEVKVTNPDGLFVTRPWSYSYSPTPTFLGTNSGSSDNAHLGAALTGIPDISGDGIGDYAVAAPNATVGTVAGAGQVYVYDGSTNALICTLKSPSPVTNGNFGASLSGAEITGDTAGDLVVGAPGQTVTPGGPFLAAGVVYVFSGSDINTCTGPGKTISTALHTLTSSSPGAGANFGAAVATGPVRGEATIDIVVGEPYAANGGTQRGRVEVFNGSTGASRFPINSPGAADGGQFGYSVAVSDMNGDTKGDIVVGEPGAPAGGVARGRVYAISGAANNGTTEIFTTPATGTSDNSRFGFAVANVGYINGDTKQEIIVSEPYAPNGATIAVGRAQVISWLSGTSVTTLGTINALVVQANSLFGYSVAGAGDVNDDGYDDIIIGQPGLNSSSGYVAVYSGLSVALGSPTLILQLVQGEPSQLGYAVGAVGDVNGDQKADVLWGDPYAAAGGVNRGRATIYAAP